MPTPSVLFRRRLSPAALMISALCAATLGVVCPPADAATPLARRLTVQIDGLRQGTTQQGADRGRERLAQQLTLSVVLRSDGQPSSSNPLDPEDGRRQLERAQAAQQRMQAAQARVAARTGRAPAVATPSPADMHAMQARAQQMQARCGTDRDCLMREAMAMSSAQVAGGDRALQARLQGYGAAVQACERSKPAGAAREACIADARRQAGGGVEDETDRDEVVETPYLHFSGRTACQLDVMVKIDGRTEGTFEDVQGTVPYTETVQAEQRKRDDSLCPLVQAVLDTRNGRLWAHTVMATPPVAGVTVRSEKGRAPQRSEGTVSLQWREVSDWLNQRLQNLNAAGEDKAKLPTAGGHNELRLRWRFEPA